MERTKIWRSADKPERFSIIQNAFGYVRVDFEMEHLEFIKEGSLGATRIKRGGHYNQVSPINDMHYIEVLKRYGEIWDLFVETDRFEQVYKDSRLKTWVYVLQNGYLHLYADVHLLMYDGKGKAMKNRSTKDLVNSISTKFFPLVEQASEQYSIACQDYQQSVKLLFVDAV